MRPLSSLLRHVGILLVVISSALMGQEAQTAGSQAGGSGAWYSAMRWRLIGPFRGGRVLAVEGVAGDPLTYYFGGAAGGVWKTTDGGLNWMPLFDSQDMQSIGAIAVAPSDANIVYVGTGEYCWRGDITYGNGMYKSTDGGRTWTHIGLRDSESIAKIRVNPANPDIVYVAAMGHPFGPNPERGVFKSTDGGKTWQKVLYKDDHTGAVDLVMDPANANILYAALYQAQRLPWDFISGGPGSGLYKSTDGGATWKQLQGEGFPRGVLGRIGVAVSGSDPERVYALVEAEHGGLLRSDNGGQTWTMVNSSNEYRQRAWYFTHIFADPKATDTLYVLNTSLSRSTDGGRTFTVVRAPHGDHHGLWIDPRDPRRMINSNDGGATITTDGGKTWTAQDNQPTAQFYHVAADNRFNYYVYGAQQDNSTVAIASRTDHGSITANDWYAVGGGESGYVIPYTPNPDVVYAGSYDGLITRYDKDTGQTQDVNPWPDNPMGHGAADTKYRFQWTAPIAISPQDPNTLYHGAQVVFRTTDQGRHWTPISKDLTRDDKSKQQSAGGPITKDNTSVEYYDTVFVIAPSPAQKGVIWAASDDGLVHVTRDDGQTWTEVTPKGFPEWSTVSQIDASRHAAGTAYAAIDNHRQDDFKPYIFKTSDFGRTWHAITNGIRGNDFVHAVRQDPQNPRLLFAGTEGGVYVSFDDGENWQPLQLNLPRVPIYDLMVKDDDLIVATHGRAFWSLDDIGPLREGAQAGGGDMHLFKPAVAWRTRRGGGFQIPGVAHVGANPPNGAVIDFYLKSAPGGPATLDILDANGKTVRHFSTERPPQPRRRPQAAGEFSSVEEEFFGPPPARFSARAGFNRFTWDLRGDSPASVPGLAVWGGRSQGIAVLPGQYQAKLTIAGKSESVPLEVKLDPRLKTTTEELRQQHELAGRIWEAINRANTEASRMIDLRAQIDDLEYRLAQSNNPQAKQLREQAAALDKKVDAVENLVVQPRSHAGEDPLNYPIRLANKLLDVLGTVESADAAPTAQSAAVFDMLSGELNAALQQWQQIMTSDVAALNAALQKANVGALFEPAGKPAGE
ncbi:MAG: glycosyl hydrolase [Acidobacteria bacterium]|nr:glycosyl hydrolase [Acidobacteriota bacterium]